MDTRTPCKWTHVHDVNVKTIIIYIHVATEFVKHVQLIFLRMIQSLSTVIFLKGHFDSRSLEYLTTPCKDVPQFN